MGSGFTHSHGPGGEHSHTGTAFTTWLDPLLALQQAKASRDALIKQRPGLAQEFSENFVALQQEVEAMDRRRRAWFIDLVPMCPKRGISCL